MNEKIDYGPFEIVCRQGDKNSDLFFLQEGRLLVCSLNGREVKAIARIERGEFIGELSFFDNEARAAYVVTLENSKIIKIPKEEIFNRLPFWYIEVGKNLTKKIRLLDEVIQSTNLRKAGSEDQKPLSIEEQRKIFSIIST